MKRFSKSIFLTILVIAMTIALVGCKSTAKAEELEPAPAAEPAPAEQPAEQPAAPAEQPAAPAEQPAAEPVAEAPAEWIVPLLGYEAKIVYEDKVATITYPSFITNEEVLNACIAAYEAYPAYFEGTSIKIAEEGQGVAYLTFPADVSYEDLDAAVSFIAAELPAYIDSVLFPTIDRTVEVYGFEVSVSYKDKVAKITYPATITRAEVADAAKTAYQAYSQYLEGTELSIGDGVSYLTFPVAITEEDLDYAVAMFSAYLPSYIEAILAQEEAVAVVAEEPAAEAPAAEPAPAAEAPAASASTSTSAPAASSSTTSAPAASSSTTSAPAASASSTAAAAQAQAQAQVAKKSNVGLIIVIIVLVIAAGAAVAIILKKKKG